MSTWLKNQICGHWNSNKIIADLEAIAGVGNVNGIGQGGDVDTENLTIDVEGTDEQLFVCGFSVDNQITDPKDTDVEFIELTDGLDYRGGLNSKNPKVADMYVRIRQYFLNLGFNVVPNLKAYF